MDERKLFALTLKEVCQVISNLGCKFHVTGGLAVSYYGEPRLTQDIDLVIVINPDDALIQSLHDALTPAFYVDLDVMKDAVWRCSMFQALHKENLLKVDFHVGEGIPGELERSVDAELLPSLTIPIASREDTLLSKLIWAKKGSGKSRQDIIGLLAREVPMDTKLVDRLAEDLDVASLLAELKQRKC